MEDNQIFEKVKSVVIKQFYTSEQEITSELSFINDLGADSLDIMEFTMFVEEEFKDYDLSIPEDEAENLTTVGKIVSYISSYIKERENSVTKN